MAGSIIHQSVHVTESRAIASRCPKLRTSKGHLVYKRPSARSQLRSRKPILRHACYNHTRSTHVQYEQQVSLQLSTKFTTLLITLTECTQRSQDCDPTLHETCGRKVGLSTDKFNKWLREALSINKPFHEDQSSHWEYTSLISRRAPGRIHLRGQWVHLKHRISKREYKVVLSKTYVGAILLMHMYQGKGRWSSIAEVPALTWLVLNYEYQT